MNNEKEYHKKWYQKNKEKIKEKKRTYWQLIKREVLDKYGGKCEICGENDKNVLTIDHKEHDGADHRFTKNGNNIYFYLRKKPKSNKYRVLCQNCNIKEYWKYYRKHKEEIKNNIKKRHPSFSY